MITKSKPLKFLFILSLSLLLLILTAALGAQTFFPKKPKSLLSMVSNALQPASLNKTSLQPFGEGGVHLFKHLYAKNNYFLTQSSPFYDFLPQGQYNYRVKPLDSKNFSSLSQKNKAKSLPGTTLILASEKGMQKMQRHYFHFLEEFILGWSAYKDLNSNDLNFIIFPDTDAWEGVNQINKQILNALVPNAIILNKTQYEKLTRKFLLQFEKAIFVDRMACHNLELVRKYNKMAIAHKHLIKPEYLREFKETVLKALKTYPEEKAKKRITYIHRKSRRYLEPEFKEIFLNELKSEFPECEVQAVWFEKYSYAEQLQIIRNTDILIAPHGNGLTHAFFLPENSLVVEIFPEGSFAMDYQLISELSGHHYFAIDPKLGIISQAGQPHPPRGNVNQVIPPFETRWIKEQIRGYLKASTGQKETSFSK